MRTDMRTEMQSIPETEQRASWSPSATEEQPTEAELIRAQDDLNESLAVNLDEVTINVIIVAFVEWVPVQQMTGPDGQPLTRYKPQVRKAEINDYVPTYLLNKMIAGHKKASRARERFLAGDETFTQDPMLAWMSDQVLAVWKLSEPDMTPERFGRGLKIEQVKGLFARFFGGLLPRQRSKV